jgi:hypothetical protein
VRSGARQHRQPGLEAIPINDFPNAFRTGHWTAFHRCDGRQEVPSLDDDLSAHASKTGVEGPYELPIVEDVNVWL